MNNLKINKITYTMLVIILISCGGVTGSIKKYKFPDFSEKEIEYAIDMVYRENPNLLKRDTTLYGMNDKEKGVYYFYLDNQDDDVYLFECNIIPLYPTELSLTSAVKWGEIMELAPNMSYFEKRKFKRIFEKNILPLIVDELER